MAHRANTNVFSELSKKSHEIGYFHILKVTFLMFFVLMLFSKYVYGNPILIKRSIYGNIISERLYSEIYLTAVFSGLLVEYLVFRFFFRKWLKKFYKAFLIFWAVNLITWPITWLLSQFLFFFAEIFPMAAEGLIYYFILQKFYQTVSWKKLIILSVIMNIISYTFGIIFLMQIGVSWYWI